MLKKWGCDQVQGFYYGKPEAEVPEAEELPNAGSPARRLSSRPIRALLRVQRRRHGACLASSVRRRSRPCSCSASAGSRNSTPRATRKALLAEGASEAGSIFYPVVAATHLAWIASLFFLISPDAPIIWPLIAYYLALQVVRYWVIASLGPFLDTSHHHASRRADHPPRTLPLSLAPQLRGDDRRDLRAAARLRRARARRHHDGAVVDGDRHQDRNSRTRRSPEVGTGFRQDHAQRSEIDGNEIGREARTERKQKMRTLGGRLPRAMKRKQRRRRRHIAEIAQHLARQSKIVVA